MGTTSRFSGRSGGKLARRKIIVAELFIRIELNKPLRGGDRFWPALLRTQKESAEMEDVVRIRVKRG